jgi:alpha-L-rhamnosidase
LQDLSLEQRDDGNVTGVVPNVIPGHRFEYGGVGWGDAATLVPWTLYEAYGDLGVLAKQYESMCRWVDYCASRRNADGVWTGDFQLGDWLDPAAPADKPELATTNSDYVATAYLSFSASRLSQAARLLGHDQQCDNYAKLSREVAEAAWRRWADQAVGTQTGCAMAIMFNIAPPELHRAIGEQLAEHVMQADGRIATGFLGTPLILPALTATGQVEAAYRLLLNRDCPGWLFQVEHGATTMWERWDAINENGTLHSGTMNGGATASMISYNHYAYGAVAAWLYRSVAGLATDNDDIGYGTVNFAPQPGGGLTRARASLVTQFGVAASSWITTPNGLSVSIDIPPGAKGQFIAPQGFALEGNEAQLTLGSGSHELILRKFDTKTEKAA